MLDILCLVINDDDDISDSNVMLSEHYNGSLDISVIVFGSDEDIVKLDAPLLSKYTNRYLCKLRGITEDTLIIAVLAYIISKQAPEATLTYLINHDFKVLVLPNELRKNEVSFLFYQILDSIFESSNNWLLSNIDSHLKDLKSISELIVDHTISITLHDIATRLRNLIEVEHYYLYGNDTNLFATVSTYSQFNQFCNSNLLLLEAAYSSLSVSVINLIPELNTRIDQINLLKQLSVDASNGRHHHMLMYWHSAYFLLLATFHKKNNKYYIGILFVLRALEAALQGFCMQLGIGRFGRHGRFELNGATCSGVGDLNIFIRNNHLTNAEQRLHDISDIITIRNNSLVGHGFAFLNDDTYNHSYTRVRDYINCLAAKTFTNSNHWLNLANYTQTNIVKQVTTGISNGLFSNIATTLP